MSHFSVFFFFGWRAFGKKGVEQFICKPTVNKQSGIQKVTVLCRSTCSWRSERTSKSGAYSEIECYGSTVAHAFYLFSSASCRWLPRHIEMRSLYTWPNAAFHFTKQVHMNCANAIMFFLIDVGNDMIVTDHFKIISIASSVTSTWIKYLFLLALLTSCWLLRTL
jgi:hypothetical protein